MTKHIYPNKEDDNHTYRDVRAKQSNGKASIDN